MGLFSKKQITTKKMITALEGKSKSDFVIPDFVNLSNSFLSIKTGKNVDEGIICYTGVDLTADEIMDKIKKNGKIGSKAISKKQLALYLEEITNHKISHKVKVAGISKSEIRLERLNSEQKAK